MSSEALKSITTQISPPFFCMGFDIRYTNALTGSYALGIVIIFECCATP